jgi:hypothetical protein
MEYTDIRMKHVKKTAKTANRVTKPAVLTIAAAIAELEKLAAKYGTDVKLVTDVNYFDGLVDMLNAMDMRSPYSLKLFATRRTKSPASMSNFCVQ